MEKLKGEKLIFILLALVLLQAEYVYSQVENVCTIIDSIKHLSFVEKDYTLDPSENLAAKNRKVSFAKNIRFKKYTVEDGLSNNKTTCIFQDSRGFIWIGTNDGVNRFDSKNFVHYRPDNTNQKKLLGQVVRCVYEDSQNRLWVGTENGGLNLYNFEKESFTFFSDDSSSLINTFSSSVNSIVEGVGNNIWLGTPRGLVQINLDKNESKLFLLSKTPHKNWVNIVFKDKDHKLWVGTRYLGVFKFNDSLNTFIHYLGDLDATISGTSIHLNNTNRIFQDNYGVFWFGTADTYMYTLDIKSNKAQKITFPGDVETRFNFKGICYDKNNNLWIGSKSGIIIMNPMTGDYHLYTKNRYDKTSLTHNSIVDLINDEQGNMWVATRYGINFVNTKTSYFHHLKEGPGNTYLNSTNVYAISSDTEGNIWIGTENQGINVFNIRTNTFRYFGSSLYSPNYLGKNIKSICPDKFGNMWIGTFNEGLFIYYPQNNTIHRFAETSDEFGFTEVRSIVQDNEGEMWIATRNKGLLNYDYATGKFHAYAVVSQEDFDRYINKIIVDNEDNVWVTGNEGRLYKFNPYTKQTIKYVLTDKDENQINAQVLSLEKDINHNLYVGTMGAGVFYVNQQGEILKRINTSTGLSSNTVWNIKIDKNNDVWFSSAFGLSKLNTTSNTIKRFYYEDGIQENQFTGAGYKTPDGYLYFGGTNGVSIFHPDSLQFSDELPKLMFSNFYLFNKKVEIGDETGILEKNIAVSQSLSLTHKQSMFSVEFNAFEFNSDNREKFVYMLEGYDKKWHFFNTGIRIATYTNLPGGRYTFKVMSFNERGEESDNLISLGIEMIPPIWERPWFKISSLFILILTVGLLYKIRVKQLKDRQELLEKTVNERTKELHKSNIKLQIQTDEIVAQNEEISSINDTLNEQKRRIEHQASELLKSNLELQEFNATKDKFFSIIAHDLKGPLGSLKFLLDDLTKDFKNETIDEIEETIRLSSSATNMIYSLLENLLTWARSQSGRMEIKLEKVSLNKILFENLNLIRERAELKNNKLIYNVGEDIFVYADHNMINTIVRNLLSNAVKYTHDGEIAINVYNKETNIQTEIADTGTGMSKDQLSKLFDLTASVSVMGTDQEMGTGLGLIICKEFIEKNNGTISVQSVEGEGSTFSFTLPIEKKQEIL